MNCNDFRKRLLEGDAFSIDDEQSQAHLQQCETCQSLRRRLMQIEAHIPMIPVPPSRGAERTKQALLGSTRPCTKPQRPDIASLSPWRRRVARIAIAVAALAILVVVGIQVGEWATRLVNPIAQQPVPPPGPGEEKKPTPRVPPPNPTELARKILDCNLELAQTRNPQDRVEILGRLADILNSETPTLVQQRKAKELSVVADLYGRVVKDGIVRRAQALPAAQGRDALHAAALQLEMTSKAHSTLARAAAPDMIPTLERMALASREGAMTLRELAKEGAQ